jgi:hypothetical protein
MLIPAEKKKAVAQESLQINTGAQKVLLLEKS